MDLETTEPRVFRKYLFGLLGLLGMLIVAGLVCVHAFREQLPPPPFTGSISFDEKAVWLSKRLQEPCEVLAIGSSMTVNNLESSAFSEHAFINASSWGMKIEQTDYFLELLLEYWKPKAVVVVTAPTDFEGDYRGKKIFDREKLKRFFDSGDLFRTHLEYLSAQYLLGSVKEIQRDRVGRGTYYALDFDAGGSVPLDLMSEGFEKVDDRWAKPLAQSENVVESNYLGLAQLAERCQSQGIRFLLVQPPIREDILTEKDQAFLTEKHWPRLAKICLEKGGAFHNFHGELSLSEEDFADSTHLNRDGAEKLSEAVARLLR